MRDQQSLYADEIRLKDVLIRIKELKNVVLMRWRFIALVAFLFALAGGYYASRKTTTYKAELTFVVEDSDSKGGLGSLGGLASQFGFDFGMGGSSTFSEGNIAHLLVSRKIVEDALLEKVWIGDEEQLLINYHIDFNNYREKWLENKPELADIQFTTDRSAFTLVHDSIIGKAWKNLTEGNVSVELGDETNITKVSCVSKNEQFAKLFVEALVKKVSAYYTKFQTAKARHSLDFIQNRADSVLIELKEAELAYARYKDSNFGVMRAEGLVEDLRLKREVEILNVMYVEIVKNLEVSKMTLLNQKPLINILDKPIYPLEVRQFTPVKGVLLFGFLGFIIAVMFVVGSSLLKEVMEAD